MSDGQTAAAPRKRSKTNRTGRTGKARAPETPKAGRAIKPPPDDAAHILVVDDDHRIRDLLGRFLMENGFRVTLAADVAVARAAMRGIAFDLVVLDVMMPGVSGMTFAEELRRGSDLAILMLTARAEPDERVKGLEIGVDDYLTKPFDPRELLLRINNILRRRGTAAEGPGEICMGEYVFHIARGDLRRGDETIKLTERERELLRLFARQPGTPIARHELVAGETSGSERAVDVQINRLRRKIEPDPSNPIYLQTVRGKGYVLYAD